MGWRDKYKKPEIAPREIGGGLTTEDQQQLVSKPEGPMTKFMGRAGDVIREGGTAGPLEQAAASLPTEPADRARFYASQRFPDDPQALNTRYGINNGRIFYVDDDGRAFFEESEATIPTSLEELGETGKAIAGSTGSMLPAIGAAVGGVATSFMGGVPGAAAGGAAGSGVRQTLASAITGEEKEISERALQAGGEAALGALGQGAGLGVARLLKPLGKTPVFSPRQTSEIAGLKAKSEATGIPLTAAELAGSKDLITRQKILAGTPEGAPIFEDFQVNRNDVIRDALYNKLFKDISPEDTVMGGMEAGVKGAREAVGQARAKMQREAAPLYEKAYEVEDVDIAPVMQAIKGKIADAAPPVRAALQRIGSELKNGGNRLAKIDNLKKMLDDQINRAKTGQETGIGKTQAYHLSDIRSLMVRQADEASPDYKAARQIYEEGMPTAASTERGVVGKIAKLEEERAMGAAKKLFSPQLSSPQTVAKARDEFIRAGQEKEWDSLVRSHLQDVFENIPEGQFGQIPNVGGQFYKAIYGNAKKMSMINEAVKHNPEIGRSLTWMMEVLRASGRAAKGESMTAFAQAGQKALEREARGVLPAMIESVEIWKSPSRIASYLNEVRTGKYAREMSKLLTDPEGLSKLKELKKLGSKSAGAIIGLSQLLTRVPGASIETAEDVKPGDFK